MLTSTGHSDTRRGQSLAAKIHAASVGLSATGSGPSNCESLRLRRSERGLGS